MRCPELPGPAGRHRLACPVAPRRRRAGGRRLLARADERGLGRCPAEQTYLDIGQGNRVFDSLYDARRPAAAGGEAAGPAGRSATAPNPLRRKSSPACSRTCSCHRGGVRGLRRRRVVVRLRRSPTETARAEADRVPRRRRCLGRGGRGPAVGHDLADRDRAAAPRPRTGSWRSGSPGAGFDGNLTSDSTRLDGYVLSTDVAPTILDASASRCRRRCRGSRSAPGARSTPPRSNRWATGWR